MPHEGGISRLQSSSSTPPPAAWCTCKKSRCLKLYCLCFSGATTCGAGCRCEGCLNRVEHSEEIVRARSRMLKRPVAMQYKAAQQKQCKCVKSFCLKKYCDCYTDSVACGPQCACVSCKNTEDDRTKREQRELQFEAAMAMTELLMGGGGGAKDSSFASFTQQPRSNKEPRRVSYESITANDDASLAQISRVTSEGSSSAMSVESRNPSPNHQQQQQQIFLRKQERKPTAHQPSQPAAAPMVTYRGPVSHTHFFPSASQQVYTHTHTLSTRAIAPSALSTSADSEQQLRYAPLVPRPCHQHTSTARPAYYPNPPHRVPPPRHNENGRQYPRPSLPPPATVSVFAPATMSAHWYPPRPADPSFHSLAHSSVRRLPHNGTTIDNVPHCHSWRPISMPVPNHHQQQQPNPHHQLPNNSRYHSRPPLCHILPLPARVPDGISQNMHHPQSLQSAPSGSKNKWEDATETSDWNDTCIVVSKRPRRDETTSSIVQETTEESGFTGKV